MLKKSVFFVVLAFMAMTLVACKSASTDNAMTEKKICQVTDTGGIDDKSFNATAWNGVVRAQDQLKVVGKYLESQQQTDYEKNINALVEDNCDLIVTVGFLLGDATKAGAEANPDKKFAIVDYAYDPAIPNVLGLVFATDQAGFLAGYTAAAATKTGKVATFGGINITPVTDFMDGFTLGVQAYNAKHGTKTLVIGWDVETREGLFAGNFESLEDGKNLGQSLLDEGVDIIMPVAGPVGLGTASAVKEHGNAWVIGVDTDWTVSAAEYKDVILTSVLKKMDNAVFAVAQQVLDGKFAGGVMVSNLANDGVGIATPAAGTVSAEFSTELEQVKADIVAGTLKTKP